MLWQFKVTETESGKILLPPREFAKKCAAYDFIWKVVRTRSPHSCKQASSLVASLSLVDDFGHQDVVTEWYGFVSSNQIVKWCERPKNSRPLRIRVTPDAMTFTRDEYGAGTWLPSHFEDHDELNKICDDLESWNSGYVGCEHDKFDWQQHYEHGLKLCRDIKQILGSEITLTFEKAFKDPDRETHRLRLVPG